MIAHPVQITIRRSETAQNDPILILTDAQIYYGSY